MAETFFHSLTKVGCRGKHRKKKKEKKPYPQPVITTNNPDSKDMLLIIKQFQPFGASGGWKPRLHIHLSETSNIKVTLHGAFAYKGFVTLWLIETPHQRPNLTKENSSS